jgi:hypothetical protein
MDIIDIYRVFHSTAMQCTFFSAAHGTFTKRDHILGHKASLKKFKKPEIMHYIISDHSEIKLELNNKRNHIKYSNTWRMNNILLNNHWVIKEIRKEIKKSLESNENEYTTYKNLWNTEKAVLKGRFIAINAYIKKMETSQINNLMMHHKDSRKTRKKLNPK